MGYSKYAKLVFGWKMTEPPIDSTGVEIDPYDSKFEPYICGREGVKETIIIDEMSENYIVFGIELGEVVDEDDFKFIDVSNLNSTALRDKFRDIFDAEAPEEDPKVMLFIHCL